MFTGIESQCRASVVPLSRADDENGETMVVTVPHLHLESTHRSRSQRTFVDAQYTGFDWLSGALGTRHSVDGDSVMVLARSTGCSSAMLRRDAENSGARMDA